jgi:hypothetical protein
VAVGLPPPPERDTHGESADDLADSEPLSATMQNTPLIVRFRSGLEVLGLDLAVAHGIVAPPQIVTPPPPSPGLVACGSAADLADSEPPPTPPTPMPMTALIERFTCKSDQVVLGLDDPGKLCPRCIVNVWAGFPVSAAHESIKSARKRERGEGAPSSLTPPPHSSTAELMASFVFVLVGDLALDVLALAPGLLAS